MLGIYYPPRRERRGTKVWVVRDRIVRLSHDLYVYLYDMVCVLSPVKSVALCGSTPVVSYVDFWTGRVAMLGLHCLARETKNMAITPSEIKISARLVAVGK